MSAHTAMPNWYDYIYLRQGRHSNLVDWIAHTTPLAAGRTYITTHNFSLPPLSVGTHRLEVHVNDSGMWEDDSLNNVIVASISIMPPDLAALKATAPSSIGAGQSFTASLKI